MVLSHQTGVRIPVALPPLKSLLSGSVESGLAESRDDHIGEKRSKSEAQSSRKRIIIARAKTKCPNSRADPSFLKDEKDKDQDGDSDTHYPARKGPGMGFYEQSLHDDLL